MSLYTRDRARRSLFETIAYRALAQGGTILSYVVLVRSMSKEAFGVLNLLYAVLPVLSTIGSLGLDHVLRRFQPEYLQSQQLPMAARLLQVVRRLRFGSNIAIIAIIILAWNWIAPWFDLGPHRGDFLIFSVVLVLHFQILILQYSLSTHMLQRFSVGSAAILSGVKLVGYGALAYGDDLSLTNALLIDAVAYSCTFGFLWYANRSATSGESVSAEFRFSGDEQRRVRRYATFSHLNDAASILQYSETDRWFIAALMSPVSAGAYAFYTRLSEMATSLVPQRLFDNMIQPLFFGVSRNEAREKIPRYFTFLINMSLIYQLPLITFTAVFHEDIVQLVFGGKFVEHSFLLPIVIAFATTDNVFSIPIHLVAQYEERTALIFKSQILGFYQIAAMLLLVPVIGLLGAALASGTFHVFRNGVVWWNVRHDGVWLNFRSVALSALATWGTAGVLCWAIRRVFAMPLIVEMALGSLVCAVAALAYLRTPAIGMSDRSILGNVLHGREGKMLHWLGLIPARAS